MFDVLFGPGLRLTPIDEQPFKAKGIFIFFQEFPMGLFYTTLSFSEIIIQWSTNRKSARDQDRDICSKYRQSYIIVRLFLEHLHMRTEYNITYTVRNIILAIWKDACCLRVQLNLGSCIARKRSSFIVQSNSI